MSMTRTSKLFPPSDATRRVALLHEPTICRRHAFLQTHARSPAQGIDALRVEQLARRPVRLARVPFNGAAITHDARHQRGDVADRAILAAADVDDRLIVIGVEQEMARLRKIVGVKEFTPR